MIVWMYFVCMISQRTTTSLLPLIPLLLQCYVAALVKSDFLICDRRRSTKSTLEFFGVESRGETTLGFEVAYRDRLSKVFQGSCSLRPR